MHHAQYRFQTFTRIWYFTSNSGISKVDCKVDLLTGPTSTSISGTSWLQSWSAHWAYFNLCFRNKVDLHTGSTIRTKHIQERWDSSAGRPSDWKARCNTDAGSSPRCGKALFSQSQLPVQTLSWCLHSPCVQSHASTSVRTLKISNTGSHTIVWTDKNTAHTVSLLGRLLRLTR